MIIYLLELEENTVYVGKSNNFDDRKSTHFKGKGAEWTKKYKPLRVKDLIDFGNILEKDEDKIETLATINVMRQYGWKNVRGGYFINVDEVSTLYALKSHMLKPNNPFNIDFLDVSELDIVFRQNNYKYLVYVILLENNFFNIGHTSNIYKTYKRYINKKGSSLNSRYAFIKIQELFEPPDNFESILDFVDVCVLEYAKKYGAEKVRGGRFTITDSCKHLELIHKASFNKRYDYLKYRDFEKQAVCIPKDLIVVS